MIDLSKKEHYGEFDKIVESLEANGHDVVCYKETYEWAKCLVDGWDVQIPHHVTDAKDYCDGFLKTFLENAEKLRSMGYAHKDVESPKFKRIKAKLEAAKR